MNIDKDNVATLYSRKRLENSASELTITKYYEGTYIPAELQTQRLDKRPKTISKVNFTKNSVGFYNGFLFGADVNYSYPGIKPSESLQDFRGYYNKNLLNCNDQKNFQNAMLYGYGIEVVSYNSQSQTFEIESHDPRDWAIWFDESGRLALAIYKAVFNSGDVFRGEILDHKETVYYVYDRDTIKIFRDSGRELQLEEEVQHVFGEVPVVVYKINDDRSSFFDSSLINTMELYMTVLSIYVDDCKYNVDSWKKLKGITLETIMKEHPVTGVTVWEKMREAGVFAIPPNADIEAVQSQIDFQKFQDLLNTLRELIHLQAGVPDLWKTVQGNGAVASVSGIALKLIYATAVQKSNEFIRYFEQGLRTRIDLMNRILGILNREQVDTERLVIKIQQNIPYNHLELVQYMPNLDGVISNKEKLRQLPFIADVENSYNEVMEEQAVIKEGTSEDNSEGL